MKKRKRSIGFDTRSTSPKSDATKPPPITIASFLSNRKDATARIFHAAQNGEIVATSRMRWGGDAPFTEHLIKHYMLAPFIAELPPETMAVGERGMVKPEMRGSPLFSATWQV